MGIAKKLIVNDKKASKSYQTQAKALTEIKNAWVRWQEKPRYSVACLDMIHQVSHKLEIKPFKVCVVNSATRGMLMLIMSSIQNNVM